MPFNVNDIGLVVLEASTPVIAVIPLIFALNPPAPATVIVVTLAGIVVMVIIPEPAIFSDVS